MFLKAYLLGNAKFDLQFHYHMVKCEFVRIRLRTLLSAENLHLPFLVSGYFLLCKARNK